jgi:hypothetical protein
MEGLNLRYLKTITELGIASRYAVFHFDEGRHAIASKRIKLQAYFHRETSFRNHACG